MTSKEPKTQVGNYSDPMSRLKCFWVVFGVANLWLLPSEQVTCRDSNRSSWLRVPLMDRTEECPLQINSYSVYCFSFAYLSFLT